MLGGGGGGVLWKRSEDGVERKRPEVIGTRRNRENFVTLYDILQ